MVCYVCGFVYEQWWCLRKHILSVHPTKLFTSNSYLEYRNSFPVKQALRGEVKAEEEEIGLVFEIKKRRKKRTPPTKKLVCNECGYSGMQNNLERHWLNAHGLQFL